MHVSGNSFKILLVVSFFFFGLNITHVLANMLRLNFGPCKKKFEIRPHKNFMSFKKVLGPIEAAWWHLGADVAHADCA